MVLKETGKCNVWKMKAYLTQSKGNLVQTLGSGYHHVPYLKMVENQAKSKTKDCEQEDEDPIHTVFFKIANYIG